MRSMLTALGDRRAALQNDEEGQKGFTLIELLVVVIIIGILAAIAIPVYLGIQGNAQDSATKSDLTNWKTGVVAAQTSNNGVVPADAAAAGVVATDGSSSPVYGTNGTTKFCIAAKSVSNKIFVITEAASAKVSAATSTSGACAATTGLPTY
ncbi:prepilin-type N-terminal cleavage/methylation domain-containing protein [Rathayibacter sp. YIM 133350]|uniref:type II secretion system protein n=1 Tax=Rathayibacter sp. YIM 133350 TaxID=3131992 RepID=UPI00307E2D68